jgi:hypothetical protein
MNKVTEKQMVGLCNLWLRLSIANDQEKPDQVRKYLVELRDLLCEITEITREAKDERIE